MPIDRNFIQAGPELPSNTYESDVLLKQFLKARMPAEIFSTIEPDLIKFGARCVSELEGLAQKAVADPPKQIQFDAWGSRIDEIQVCDAWRALDRVSAEEGLVAIGYERKQVEFSRLYQFAKLYLFHPSSAFYSCPLAMTDGAARVLELHGTPELKATAFQSLTSRDASKFWTSGQWMTERAGGSDVSQTSTVARTEGGKYRLSGDKWFTSATTSQMTLALAKVEGAADTREGLSLFFLKLHDEKGRLKNITVSRLKEKLGTKALPTAELKLDGVEAEMIGAVGEGVKRVSSLLNITRVYNSVCAVGAVSRALTLSIDYTTKRTAFGRKLSDLPLHLKTLADVRSEFTATFLLCFHVIHLLGRDETWTASADERAILRLMTPVVKLWSAKQAVGLTSELIESFGGAGYIEDTGLPQLLRDAQVFSIWEGTTNVLSLDTLRAIGKDNALVPCFNDIEKRLKAAPVELVVEVARVREAAAQLQRAFATLTPDVQEAAARQLAFGLARTFAATLLIEAVASGGDAELARQFIRKTLFEPFTSDELRQLVFASSCLAKILGGSGRRPTNEEFRSRQLATSTF